MAWDETHVPLCSCLGGLGVVGRIKNAFGSVFHCQNYGQDGNNKVLSQSDIAGRIQLT